MRVLVTGAYGLIGSAVVARLRTAGHDVVATRRASRTAPADIPWIHADFARATEAEWLGVLAGVDAVVNCVGLLQGSPGSRLHDAHVRGPAALFAACARARVKRVIHFSAVGIDREQPTEFSRTKLEGDEALMRRDLDWVILRPSVVLGRAAYGGSALFRALAALPGFVPVLADAGPLQVVQLDDVTATVLFFLEPDSPSRCAVELVGPEALPLLSLLLAYRRWLGLAKPRAVRLPQWLAALAFRVGDVIGLLGWRPPVRSTAAREIARGAVGDPGEWTRLTGIRPRSLGEALAAEPASVQEKWFARLYVLKPAVIGGLALFWIVSGLIALGAGYGAAAALMYEAGAGIGLAALAVVSGSALDILIGAGIAFRKTCRTALWTSIAVTAGYVALGTLLLPRLWLDPLGPLVKTAPLVLLTLVALAILEDR